MSEKKEAIFSYAVALQQSGRLRNSVYARDRTIYILNLDKTVLLRFELPQTESAFKTEISFYASDYDSEKFLEEDAQVVFVKKEGNLERKKYCTVPGKSFEEINSLYLEYKNFDPNVTRWGKEVISLLDEDLSHLEIAVEDNSFVILQKDIYTGSTIRIEKSRSSLSVSADQIQKTISPIGLRTNDFIALFSFNDWVKFYFPSSNDIGYIRVRGNNFKMDGIISKCYYDEMGKTTLSSESETKRSRHGR